MSLAIVHTYIKSEQPHHCVPLGALLEAPFTLLFLSTELGECEGPGRRLPSPKVTQQGREMNRGRRARWAGSPSLSPWSPGEPGPRLRGRAERKGDGVVGQGRRGGKGEASRGRGPSPAPPAAGSVKQRQHASRPHPAGAPRPPGPPEPSEARVLMVVAMQAQALGSPGQWWRLRWPPAFR